MAKKLSRLDLSSITGLSNDIYEIDAVYFDGEEPSSYATRKWVEELLVNKVDYLGAVESMNKLPTGKEVGAGDFCRVKTAFSFGTETAHEGDLLIALSDNPAQSILGWDLIHNEYDWTHTHTFTPAGTVSQPTFTGKTVSTKPADSLTSVSAPSHTHSATVTGDVTITTKKPAGTQVANYTPAGTIDTPTFTGTPTTTSQSSASISAVTSIQSATASQPVFTGSQVTSLANTGQGINAVTSVSAELASAPTFTGSSVYCESCGSTGGITVIGTLKMPTFKVSEKILTIEDGSSIPVMVASYTHTHKVTAEGTVSKPAITVTTGTSAVAPNGHTHKVTAAGDVSAPTITIKPATASVASAAHTHTVTAEGTVSPPTFTGTGTVIEGNFKQSVTTDASSTTVDVAGAAHTHTVTAEGTVSTPTFTGSEGATSAPKA